jgi:hypothetical protein
MEDMARCTSHIVKTYRTLRKLNLWKIWQGVLDTTLCDKVCQ